ncbi:TWiK family of potassium channels protein 18-like isoform X2 [Anthonomus grandis grandis]|uniref:TWiK family of potassium channels protein 18-like isoform X2 n=1 Tax=Anthonomus grandis grandis TaxID=2921223 RepID=UPI0021664C96|nr:TWiK family of potassium channels protein 18-like isoform X2 [Anthonomus grandis grandis]
MENDQSDLHLAKSVAGGSSEKKVGFARPTLIIPPPQQVNFGPSEKLKRTPSVPKSSHTPRVTYLTLPIPEEGLSTERKTSQIMFDHINHLRHLGMSTAKTSLGFGEKFAYWLYNKVKSLSKKWFTHCFLTIVMIIYTIGGALSFIAIEEPYESSVTRPVLRDLRYIFIRELTELSNSMPNQTHNDEWMKLADERMNVYFGQVIEDERIKQFIKANRGPKVWTLINSIVFCATIYTTIGYGHMYPKTNTGRALSIVYALIGIPLFLIALTDFGKLFTRGIKFAWSFVRRLYYTGSCRNVRKNSGVDDIFKGAQHLYDYATFKRPSFFDSSTSHPDNESQQQTTTDTPTTPAISAFEIDDEFNLPISVALFILVAYIFCGAVMYMLIEGWTFFECFYFVFISMTTIGFGDYVPRDPWFMIGSIVYLVFGLALMSMCINVVQAKLSDTFKQASAKIGATMGLEVEEEEAGAEEEEEEETESKKEEGESEKVMDKEDGMKIDNID